MAKRGNIREYTLRRRKRVLMTYLDVIKEKGEEARYLSKSYLYGIVSERCDYSVAVVRSVITQMLRDNVTLSKLDEDELRLLGK